MSASKVAIGDLTYYVDDESGEIVTVEGDTSAERIDYMITQYLFARDQAKQWDTAKSAYGAVIRRLLDEEGLARRSGDAGSATAVPAGVTRSAPAENLVKARTLELITDAEVADLAIRAAKELDLELVEAWIDERPEPEREKLRAILVTERPRRGYTNVRAPRVAAPQIRKG